MSPLRHAKVCEPDPSFSGDNGREPKRQGPEAPFMDAYPARRSLGDARVSKDGVNGPSDCRHIRLLDQHRLRHHEWRQTPLRHRP
jgi:hypothetical protein